LKRNRGISFFFTVVVYAFALVAALYVYRHISGGAWLRVFAADLAATGLIYLVSLPLGNASVYDPYWSVAPITILPLATMDFGVWNAGTVVLLFCVGFWGVRLTANWVYTFRGYGYQDWRYTMLREKSGVLYPLVSLFGIMLFPTLVVYLCLLPALRYIQTGGVNLVTILGFSLCIAAATLQLVADIQLHRFQKRASNRGQIIRTGVWRHARHPNYLGEILLWWGVYSVMLSVQPQFWPLGAGALVNTLMFLFISIPMAEKRLAGYKEGYGRYVAQTNRLLPISLKRAVNGNQD
jgi:steroid 5-alpha reductase family enzyme